MTAAAVPGPRGRRDEEYVLLEVTTPDGRAHTVAAVADAPVAALVDALIALVLTDTVEQRSGARADHHLEDRDGRRWDGAATLRTLGVLHGSDVRLCGPDRGGA